ncbi:hypothetical protein PanWU01x14_363410 [Parasponia andersonii]|uniref:Transmembrane protein n=1 Tax=Parasponia andersonii TaxID=3476 RepID=A0A2P5A6L6_PARAD|nr:hypothetical protein PanWU01x14_363410 [Parasponia andersonii]
MYRKITTKIMSSFSTTLKLFLRELLFISPHLPWTNACFGIRYFPLSLSLFFFLSHSLWFSSLLKHSNISYDSLFSCCCFTLIIVYHMFILRIFINLALFLFS